jgi:ROS/MUCR transcriptional regulator protein
MRYSRTLESPIYGEIGILAFDHVADRLQCHACGGWLQKLETRHLRLHKLPVPLYKERYGLNASQPLETPRLTELRRRKNREHGG